MNEAQLNKALIFAIASMCSITILAVVLIGNVTTTRLDNMIDSIERMELYNHTVQIKTKENGFYRTNEMFCVWVKDRSIDHVYRTTWHELAHHDIILSRNSTSTQYYVDLNTSHFCGDT